VERTAIDCCDHPSALDVLTAPVVVLVGNFGAGKTEIAVNLAFAFRARNEQVALVDLDLVKPYFRSRFAKQELEEHGISVVVPEGERFYADLPILVPQARGLLANAAAGDLRVIVDVGGDDHGARVLGSLADVVDPARTEILFVVNGNRPFAENVEAVGAMIGDVERAARLKITGLVANTHLMEETTPAIVASGVAMPRLLAERTGIPLRFAAALGRFFVSPGLVEHVGNGCPMLAIERRIVAPFGARPAGSRRRSIAV
jgi:hypothetical protein